MEIFSLILYPFILLFPFAAYVMVPLAWQRHKFLFYGVVFFPIAMMAALRGTVGTDTENYREAFELFNVSQYNVLTVDPIFSALFALAKVLGFNFNGFACIHAALCLLFYSYGASKVDKVVPLFGLMLMPVLFLDATFNGVRYGLAFGIALTTLYFFQRSKSSFRVGYLLPPIAAHSSLSILILLVPGLLILVAPFMLLLNIQDLLYFSYFSDKSDSYSEFSRPGMFSGIVPVFQFCILFFITRINKVRFEVGANLQFLASLVFVVGLAASSISYAGLRILQLAVFVIAVFAAERVTHEKRRTTIWLLTAAGLMSVANFLRQIFLVGPAGGVSFHPYNFFNLF